MKISHLLKKSGNIVQGFTKLLFKDEVVEAYALQRSFICETCPDRRLVVCTKCGCFIEAKVRSKDEQCPKNLWKKE